MLSWAQYLFGSGNTQEAQQDEAPQEAVATETHSVAMDDAAQSQEWIVVDYEGKKKSSSVGMSDMENLLIEHPSMSVYKRSGSEGDDSDHSEASLEQAVVSSKRSQAVSRQTPRRLRVVSARAQLLTQVQKVKVAQRSQLNQSTRRLSRNRLDLSNKVAMNERHKSRKIKMQRPSGQRNGRVSQRVQ